MPFYHSLASDLIFPLYPGNPICKSVNYMWWCATIDLHQQHLLFDIFRINATLNAHSENTQRILREHSGITQTSLREHSENIQRTPREHSEVTQRWLREHLASAVKKATSQNNLEYWDKVQQDRTLWKINRWQRNRCEAPRRQWLAGAAAHTHTATVLT